MSAKPGRHQAWLHIGMPKTGTTSIQRTLYRNRRALLALGYHYPDFQDPQHVALVRRIARESGSRVPQPMVGDCGDHRRLTDLLTGDAAGAHTSIVSSENFFQRPACLPGLSPRDGIDPFAILQRAIAKTAEYLEGCDVTVVAWLRRQDHWLMSMYNETVKTSLFDGPFDTFHQYNIGADILRVAQLWIEAFGRDRVVLQSYDALARSKADVVDTFFDTVCPGMPRDTIRKLDAPRNPSLSIEGLWLKSRINAMYKREGRKLDEDTKRTIRRLVLDVSRASPDPSRPILSLEERRRLMDRFLESNRRLVSELGYAELAPLIDVSDLAGESPPGLEGGPPPWEPALDQMIRTFVMRASADGN